MRVSWQQIRVYMFLNICRLAVRSTPSALGPDPPKLRIEPLGALPSRRAHLSYPKSIQDPSFRSLLTVTYTLKVVTFRPNCKTYAPFEAGQCSRS
jgi:hypothetical protein